MIILFDTDVLLDIALNRPGFATAAGELLDCVQAGKAKGYIAWHSISNFYYLVRPTRSAVIAKDFIGSLLTFVDVAPAGTKEAKEALRLPFKDFEDALQCSAALAVGASIIATRNIKDFRSSPIPARPPRSILKQLGIKV